MNASLTISGQLSARSDFDDYRQANKIKSARFLFDRDERGSFSSVRPFGLGAFMPGETGNFTIGNYPLERNCKIKKLDNAHYEYKYSGRVEKKRFAGLAFYCQFNASEKFDQNGNLIESTVDYTNGAPEQLFRLTDNSLYAVSNKKRVRTVFEPTRELLVTVVDDYAAVFVTDHNGYILADSISLKGSVRLFKLYPDLHQECLSRQARQQR